MLENQADDDATDLLRNIKTDLASEEVYVLTPKGDVLTLPLGSTVIDVAYNIHSAVGNRMTGARVDGKIVPIDYKVKTGEIVEILTRKEGGNPNRDWLKIVKTSEARSKIRQWFKKEKREENIAEGKAELEREFKHAGIQLTEKRWLNSFPLFCANSICDKRRPVRGNWLRRRTAVENHAARQGGVRKAQRAC